MFKRGKPLTLIQTAKQFFWPEMGWKRSIVYMKHRLLRVADTTHSIALGLAIGLGVSFTPLLGTHFIQAALIAFLFRGNVVAAMIGTWIGNPWTFPFFWWAGFSFGSFLFGFLGLHGAENIPEHLTFAIIYEDFWALFMPWMLGGYILLVISIPASYLVYYKMIESAKIAREKAKALRVKERKKVSIKAPKE
tara:strand:+ start:33778 stop:34353 length:576 start_codon:yes stop_codon:yes gene_type:complete